MLVSGKVCLGVVLELLCLRASFTSLVPVVGQCLALRVEKFGLRCRSLRATIAISWFFHRWRRVESQPMTVSYWDLRKP